MAGAGILDIIEQAENRCEQMFLRSVFYSENLCI